MSLFVSSLASGSNGNCYYIGNETEAILVDAGISCKEIEKRMTRQGLSMQKVRAILISHEHSDHIYGLPVIKKKYNLPVYISTSTLIHSGLSLDKSVTTNLAHGVQIEIGSLTVTPFRKIHDAVDPFSFVIGYGGTSVGVFTDIGLACPHVKEHFNQCDAVFLETNYDEEMLKNGKYPWPLKKRITGGKGHLSNAQALDLFINHRSERLSHLFLSHLSRNNNCPVLVQDLFKPHGGKTSIILASREKETEVYHIQGTGSSAVNKKSAPLMRQGVLALD